MRLELKYTEPFDWPGLLAFFRPRAIAGVETVADGALIRSLRVEGVGGMISVRRNAPLGVLELDLTGRKEFLALAGKVELLARRVLDLDFAPAAMLSRFGGDPALGLLVRRWPGVRLPGAWNSFEMGVRAILGQQVSVKAAHTLAGRLVRKYGLMQESPWPEVNLQFPAASVVGGLGVEELMSLGLTRKRAETLIHFARWWGEDAATRRPMLDLPGIGPWTENYVRMRGNSEADAFPAGDLGIHKALGIQELGPLRASRAAEASSLAWKPWRAYAVMLLWRSLAGVEEAG